MNPMTDGEIIITDMSSEVAAMLWRELFQAKQQLATGGLGLAADEMELFNALTSELKARVADTAARRPKKEAAP